MILSGPRSINIDIFLKTNKDFSFNSHIIDITID